MTTTASTLAGLALAALALAGCGGDAPSSAPSSAPPSSPAAGGAAPSSAAGTPSPAASGSPGAATFANPCRVLDARRVSALTGVEVQEGATQTAGGSTICSWAPTNRKASDAAVFSAQEGPLPAPLSQVERALAQQFDGTVSRLEVDGADDARFLAGKKSGLNVIDVLAQKDSVFYQVLAVTPRDAGRHKQGAVKVTEALIRG